MPKGLKKLSFQTPLHHKNRAGEQKQTSQNTAVDTKASTKPTSKLRKAPLTRSKK